MNSVHTDMAIRQGSFLWMTQDGHQWVSMRSNSWAFPETGWRNVEWLYPLNSCNRQDDQGKASLRTCLRMSVWVKTEKSEQQQERDLVFNIHCHLLTEGRVWTYKLRQSRDIFPQWQTRLILYRNRFWSLSAPWLHLISIFGSWWTICIRKHLNIQTTIYIYCVNLPYPWTFHQSAGS